MAAGPSSSSGKGGTPVNKGHVGIAFAIGAVAGYLIAKKMGK